MEKWRIIAHNILKVRFGQRFTRFTFKLKAFKYMHIRNELVLSIFWKLAYLHGYYWIENTTLWFTCPWVFRRICCCKLESSSRADHRPNPLWKTDPEHRRRLHRYLPRRSWKKDWPPLAFCNTLTIGHYLTYSYRYLFYLQNPFIT